MRVTTHLLSRESNIASIDIVDALLCYLVRCGEGFDKGRAFAWGARRSTLRALAMLSAESRHVVAERCCSGSGRTALSVDASVEAQTLSGAACIGDHFAECAEPSLVRLNTNVLHLIGVPLDPSLTGVRCTPTRDQCAYRWVAEVPVVDVSVNDRVLSLQVHEVHAETVTRDLLRSGASTQLCVDMVGVSRRRVTAIKRTLTDEPVDAPRGPAATLSAVEVAQVENAMTVLGLGLEALANSSHLLAMHHHTGITPARLWRWTRARRDRHDKR